MGNAHCDYATSGGDKVRADYVPAEDYTSRDFALLEKERMWPKVWQVACRQEQIPNVGDHLVYDICDESIIVVRSGPDKISAFYNSCAHRGRQLVSEPGRSKNFICPFHGWRFDLTGKCQHIPYFENWNGEMGLDEVGLTSVECDIWGGFVFVNMDPDCGPLREFLGKAADLLDPYEFENMRFRWMAAVETDANWKLTIEAFNEAYHVQTTHVQLLPSFDDRTTGNVAGPHGYLTRDGDAGGLGHSSSLLNRPPAKDVRPVLLDNLRQMTHDVRSVYSERDLSAAARVMTELPEGATPMETLVAAFQFRKEAAEAAGVGWPRITMEEIGTNGSTWHIFPNMIVLPQPTASLWYRARPLGRGEDPERCLFEFWALERYAPGYAPPPSYEYHTDWKDFKGLPPFLVQDYMNLPYMQKGVRTRGFKGARTNPSQERIITNFHANLRKLVGRE